MKHILSAQDVRDWDAFTIKNEPISSYDLMERAAKACLPYIEKNTTKNSKIAVVSGPGNNGGDGLDIARHLLEMGYNVNVFILKFTDFSEDCKRNFDLLPKEKVTIVQPNEENHLLDHYDIYIDALFGTGLSRAIEAPLDYWVNIINKNNGITISIDMPSGIFSDESKQPENYILADYTLTFQCYKKAMTYAHLKDVFGTIECIDIGLLSEFLKLKDNHLFAINDIQPFLKKNSVTAHKYDKGMLLIHAGSPGMKGARELVTLGAQAAGAGLTNVLIEETHHFPIPEALTTDYDEDPSQVQFHPKINAVVSGPGIGKNQEKWLRFFEKSDAYPVLFDADAINIISKLKSYKYPEKCILTPHHGELKRLIGKWEHEDEMISKAQTYAKNHQIVIVAKGALTKIITPSKVFVNYSGNELLATAGSGDFLSGLIGGFLAKGYSIQNAAICGVYAHGKSADLWKMYEPNKALKASDLSKYCLTI